MSPEFKEKSAAKVDLICSTCGKPISDKARGNVTRFLGQESRCTCMQPKIVEVPDDGTNETGAETPNGIAQIDRTKIDQSVIENLGDRFEVLELLGQGGMGAVYKVRDKVLNQTFAVKVLNPNLVEDKNSVKRFEQEAKAATNLTHVNLCAVYDYGMGTKGAPYLVMDYLDGKNLADIIVKEGYLDEPRALDIFIQAADALSYAHVRGVIHRDIKPNNIIVEEKEGDIELVKIVDFGIAKVLPNTPQATANLTQTGEILGSPLYMSPEQCLGNKLDARTDIYAMGCIMYETLTGKAPFAAENSIKTVLKHVNEDPIHISDLKEDYKIPRDLERVIFHCLEKRPEDRYQTADELRLDLERVRDGVPLKFKRDPLKKPAPKTATAKRTASQRWLRAAIHVFCIVVVPAAIIFMCFPNLRTGTPALTGDPYADAERLDQLSAQYFSQGQYEKAIPYLEFGLKVYKEGGRHFPNQYQESLWLADQIQHIGKCYLQLHEYAKAQPYYQKALKIYNTIGKWESMTEAVNDYATVLKGLGKTKQAQALVNEYNSLPTRGQLESIP